LEFALQECAAPFGFGTVFYNSKDCGILFVGAHSWTDSTTAPDGIRRRRPARADRGLERSLHNQRHMKREHYR